MQEVVYGRHQSLFKLKTEHTVDFICDNISGDLSVYDTKKRKKVVVAKMDLMSGSALQDEDLLGKVVECCPPAENDDLWRLKIVRHDKNVSNDLTTYERTCLNAREKLTLERVLDLLSPIK
jgi:hypothetical protein